MSRTHPATKQLQVSDLTKLAPTSVHDVVTRTRQRETGLAHVRGVLKVREVDDEVGRPSIVSRRQAAIRKRRKKRLLIAAALLLALFPPMWAVYLIGWLVWRSQPKQKSMRSVRKAIKSLEKNQAGVALKNLQEAHLLDPSNTDALYWLGLLLSQQERHDEAEEALAIVAQRVPGLPEVETMLARSYIALDEPQNAVYHAQRLLDAEPYAPESLLILADAFEADGRLDLAARTLEQAPLGKRTLNDALVRVHYRLGDLYERMEDPAKAREHFDRVYMNDVTFGDVKERLESLRAATPPPSSDA